MNELSAARPYAIAAYETAVEMKTLDAWEKALQFLAELTTYEEIKEVITNPNIEPKELMALYKDFGKDLLNAEHENFLKLLAQVEKLILLPEIFQLFLHMRATINEKVDVDVTSVVALSDVEKEALKKSLQQRLQREPVLTFKEDSSLLGGILVHAGDIVIDGTVKTQLQRFKEALKG